MKFPFVNGLELTIGVRRLLAAHARSEKLIRVAIGGSSARRPWSLDIVLRIVVGGG